MLISRLDIQTRLPAEGPLEWTGHWVELAQLQAGLLVSEVEPCVHKNSICYSYYTTNTEMELEKKLGNYSKRDFPNLV